MDAAQRLFTGEGYNRVGVDRIASEAGVSKKTMYEQFTSKDELLTAMLRDRGPGMADAVLPAEDADSTAARRVHELFFKQRDVTRQREFTGCPFVNVATEMRDAEHPATKLAAGFKGDLTGFLEGVVSEGGAADPHTLAVQLTVMYNGAAVHALLHGMYPDETFAALDSILAAHGLAS